MEADSWSWIIYDFHVNAHMSPYFILGSLDIENLDSGHRTNKLPPEGRPWQGRKCVSLQWRVQKGAPPPPPPRSGFQK